MDWLKDYGAFVAATVAATATIINGWLAARRDKRNRDEHWLRELRIPRYVELIRAADTLDWSTFKEYGDWDQDDNPVPAGLPSFAEASRQFRHALADVELVGPEPVARAALHVQWSIWQYRSELDTNPLASTPTSVRRTRNEFMTAATAALGLPFKVNDEYGNYMSWRNEQKAIDEEAEA